MEIGNKNNCFANFSEPGPTSTSNNANPSAANIPQNILGPNNNPYHHPNINQLNLFDEAVSVSYPRQNIRQTQQFPIVTLGSVHNAHLFSGGERQETKPSDSEPLSSVIFSHKINTAPKTASAGQAFTTSTYSTIETQPNPVVNETASSVPLFSGNQVKKQPASFPNPTGAIPKISPGDRGKQFPLFNASPRGSANTPREAESSVPLYSDETLRQPSPRTNTESSAPRAVPLFCPGDLSINKPLPVPQTTGKF